jgi:hypothetical protein
MNSQRSNNKLSARGRTMLKRILTRPPSLRSIAISMIALEAESDFEMAMLLVLSDPLAIKISELVDAARDAEFESQKREISRLKKRNWELLAALRNNTQKQRNQNEPTRTQANRRDNENTPEPVHRRGQSDTKGTLPQRRR